MNQIYFTADCHFGHRAVCKYRTQFKNPTEHDDYIISNWNRVIKKKNQHIWVLGDMCINNKNYDFDKLLKRLNGTIHIITGNHCDLDAYKNISVERGLVKKYGFWLSHSPIHPSELRGHINIHGHIHNKVINDNRYFCVCPEHTNYQLVDLYAIRETIKQRNNNE